MKIALSKIFPIQSIENDFLDSGNGDISFAYECFLPDVYSFSEGSAIDLNSKLTSLLKTLPVGCSLHVQERFFSKEYKPTFETNYSKKSLSNHFTDRNFSYHQVYFIFTYSNDDSLFPDSEKNSYLNLTDLIFKNPLKDLEKYKNSLENILLSIETSMNKLEVIKYKRLNNLELKKLLVSMWNLSYNDIQSESDILNEWNVENFKLKIGNENVGIISMVEEPSFMRLLAKGVNTVDEKLAENVSYTNVDKEICSFLYPIGLGLAFNHITNLHYKIVSKSKANSHLNSGTDTLKNLAKIGSSRAQQKLYANEQFKNYINLNDMTACTVALNVIVHDSDEKLLNRKIEFVKSSMKNLGFKPYVESSETPILFVTSTPGTMQLNYKRQLALAEHAVNYINKETYYLSDGKGYLFVDRHGKLVNVDINTSPYTETQNVLMFGPSGEGKSYNINGYIDQTLYNKGQLFILDVGGTKEVGSSYRKLASVYDLTFLDSAYLKTFSFPIFDCPKDIYGNYQYLDNNADGEDSNGKIIFIYTVLVALWKDGEKGSFVRSDQRVIIETSIIEYYNYCNSNKLKASLTGYYEFIDIFINGKYLNEKEKEFVNFQQIKTVLKPYAIGVYKDLLNGDKEFDINSQKGILIDIFAIKDNPSIMTPLLIVILEMILQKIKNSPLKIFKSFILDEGFDFLHSDLGPYIGYFYRTFRKSNAQVFLATQSVSLFDSLPSDIRNSIISNTDIKILLSHKKDANKHYPDLERLLSLTKHDISLLDSLVKAPTYREFFLKRGTYSKVYRNEQSPQLDALYTTRPSEVNQINKYYEITGNMLTAIDMYVDNKYSNLN